MPRNLMLALISVLALATGCKAKPDAASGSTTPTPIGVILPLTGNAAVYGKALQNGIELAKMQDADSDKVRLIYEDDRGLPNDSLTATRKLIAIDKVPAIIGGAMSSTAEPIIPVCDGARVVLVSPTATKPELVNMSKYFFRLWPSDNYDGKAMAQVAFKDLGLRRVVILYVNTAYGSGISDVFFREFTRLGGVVVERDGYEQNATDFRAYLTKIKGLDFDAIYLPGYVSEITQLLKQARDLNLRTTFLGVNSLHDPQLVKIAGSAAEGAVFTYPTFDPASSDSEIAPFVEAYRERYRADPDPFAAQGYDSYRVMSRALKSLGARKVSGETLREALGKIGEYQGPGGTFTFSSNGDVEKPLRLMTVENGKFVEFVPRPKSE